MSAFDGALARRNTAARPALGADGQMPADGRAGLLTSSALAGGALRGLALAVGVSVLGASPALAQVGCQSAATDLSAGGTCSAAAATGTDSTAVGADANATGASATAFGRFAT